MPKPDYDTTLARIAGNIASGMDGYPRDYVVKFSMAVAEGIVEKCREKEKATRSLSEVLQQMQNTDDHAG